MTIRKGIALFVLAALLSISAYSFYFCYKDFKTPIFWALFLSIPTREFRKRKKRLFSLRIITHFLYSLIFHPSGIGLKLTNIFILSDEKLLERLLLISLNLMFVRKSFWFVLPLGAFLAYQSTNELFIIYRFLDERTLLEKFKPRAFKNINFPNLSMENLNSNFIHDPNLQSKVKNWIIENSERLILIFKIAASYLAKLMLFITLYFKATLAKSSWLEFLGRMLGPIDPRSSLVKSIKSKINMLVFNGLALILTRMAIINAIGFIFSFKLVVLPSILISISFLLQAYYLFLIAYFIFTAWTMDTVSAVMAAILYLKLEKLFKELKFPNDLVYFGIIKFGLIGGAIWQVIATIPQDAFNLVFSA